MKRREFMKGAVVTGAGAAAAVSTLPKPAIAQGSKESMRRLTISERILERMTKAEIAAAQRAWAKYVVERDVDQLLDLYDFGTPDEPLLFKPTLADVIRLDREGARSYFVGGNPNYPHDHGFLNRGWKQVDFRSAAGPILTAGGLGCMDMGHYTFVDGDGNGTRADYTFAYHKLAGRVLISLHHSSLTWLPPAED